MDDLTFTDLNGRRRPRRFAVVSGLILLGLFVFAGIDRAGRSPLVEISDIPVQNVSPEAAWPDDTVVPASTQAEEPCPAEPENWDWLEIFPGDHYRLIQTPCVVSGISRTAAWMLAVRLGFSKTEAAGLLGFADLPWSPQSEILAFTNLSGPHIRELMTEWPAHPEFFFWQVDREGRPAVTISLRGCYLLDGAAYCVVALDRLPGTAVSVLGEYAFASHAAAGPANRSFFLLAYGPGGDWHLVGQFSDTSIEVKDEDQLASERVNFLDRLGVEVWDADWLFARYAVAMKALPDNWRLLSMADEDVQAIAGLLNLYLPAVQGADDE